MSQDCADKAEQSGRGKIAGLHTRLGMVSHKAGHVSQLGHTSCQIPKGISYIKRAQFSSVEINFQSSHKAISGT